LREALAIAGGAQIAATVADCLTTGGQPKANVYCPFYGSSNSTAGECTSTISGTVDGPSADTIRFLAPNGRGTVQLVAPLPAISQPVTIVGLGPDQNAIQGSPSELAALNPPPASGSSPSPAFFNVPLFQISPNLPDGAEVKFENLTLRGTRIHYFRSTSADADCGNTTATPPQPACTSAEPNKSVINFAGVLMDNGTSAARKKLTFNSARLVCHRREASGGAVSVFGRAKLTVDTTTFSNNVSELGSGGAIFAGAKDNGSPEVSVVGSRFDADAAQQCIDAVQATYRDVNTPVACNSASSSSNANSPCPAAGGATNVYLSYAPGNFAGAAAVAGGDAVRASAPIPVIGASDVASTAEVDGGAIAVNALNATLGNIGSVAISGSRFFNSSARRNGGALSLAHVARDTPSQTALTITDSLFSSPGATAVSGNNRAAGNGGAISIIGNANQQTSSALSFVSFSFNRANGDGGAFSYTTQPGAPIDFNMSNVRFGFNSAGSEGGAIHANDNGVDDSGILNVAKATFDNNTSGEGGGAIFCGATKAGSQFTNVTLSANFAGTTGGGLYVGNRCHVSINNATITDNGAGLVGPGGQGTDGGGGIFVPISSANARVDVRNSVLAFNKSRDNDTDPALGSTASANGPDCSADNNDVLRSAGFNFVGTNSGCANAFVSAQTNAPGVASTIPGNNTHKCLNTSTGDIVGRSGTSVPACSNVPLNPLLRLLSDNGGVEIQGARNFTHFPENNSPVINNASSTGCRDGLGAAVADDQRGFFRSGAAGRCDIGAVEVGGGQTPGTGAITAVSGTVNLPTLVRLPAFEQEVEMLRVGLTAPAAQAVTVTSLTIRPEDPESGIAALYTATSGRYGSVRGFEITAVDAEGRDLGNPLYRITGAPADLPAFDSNSRLLTIPFSSPFQLSAGQTAHLSVRLIFEPRLTQLAMGETGIMVAAAGGLGVVAFLGMLGAGVSRRRALLIAGVLMAATAVTGCGGGDDSFDDGSRTFRLSARQITFDTASAQNNSQSLSVTGPTVTVLPP
jgi:predicted outer membrane repeat protein